MENVTFLVYYWWLFASVKHSNSSPDTTLNATVTEPLLETNQTAVTTKRLSSSFKTRLSFAWNHLTQFALQMKILSETYCKDVYSEAEVEKLLDIVERYGDNWWRDKSEWDFYHPEIANPLCSTTPNGGGPIFYKISEDEFFQARKINIPIRLGRKGIRLNKYEHLNKEPIWRMTLECDCDVSGSAVAGDNVCVNGKNVNLSRGVGGDRSFFIHAPNSSGSYKVVAHICFPIE